ncbi:hypothetical protein AVEN_123333-1 [Araneus ventricosus]|uniref:Transposable element P transposase-like RNase H C-terminal domain-containing protein n=1 Tax=Araneus ventricosus TaxID=182803 RepID=A0A4Y2VEB9_ARAVE|nr:hypothetical protein AVEN_123333-1 [Araneus ventricosus]
MIRSRGGYNNNPYAKQFKAAYKQLLVRHEIASSENANCISLSKINILSVGSQGKSKNNFVQNINHDNDRRLSDDLQIIDNSEAATSDHAYSKVPSSKILSKNEILRPIVVPYAAAIGDESILLEDNAGPHHARLVENFVLDDGPFEWKDQHIPQT